jgi:hypothetical protein
MASIDGLDYDSTSTMMGTISAPPWGTETLAARDMIPDEFKVAAGQAEQTIGGKRFLIVDQSANQRAGSKISKIWDYGKELRALSDGTF